MQQNPNKNESKTRELTFADAFPSNLTSAVLKATSGKQLSLPASTKQLETNPKNEAVNPCLNINACHTFKASLLFVGTLQI